MDQFHSIQSPADIHYKIKGFSLMKKLWQDTECLSMHTGIQQLEI